jgi:hypothetical protein
MIYIENECILVKYILINLLIANKFPSYSWLSSGSLKDY